MRGADLFCQLLLTIDVNGKFVELDEDGFLVKLNEWRGYLALAEQHWKSINYLREYFAEYGITPTIRKMTKETDFSLKEIYELFPPNLNKGACKIAGLPKPTDCV